MHFDKYKYLNFTSFKNISQWYVEYYLNDCNIRSRYSLMRLKQLIEPVKDVIKKKDYDGKTPIVEKIVFKTGKVVFREKRTTGMNLYALQQNNLIISNINFHQGATALNTFGDIVASTHYQPYKIKINLVRPEFLTMVLRTPYFLNIVSGKKAHGIKNESGYSFIGSFNLPLPELIEQDNIISQYKLKIKEAEDIEKEVLQTEHNIENFLLNSLGVTRQNKEEKISSYKYMRFINYQYVSEWGIDTIKKMREKEFFKYPKVKIKNLCLIGSGGTPSRSFPQYFKGNIPWVKTGEVVNDIILGTEEHITEDAINHSSAKLYPKGSLIIAMYGQGDTRGRTAKLGIDATTNQACAVLYEIDNSVVSTDYLWYYLQGRYHDLRSFASGNNQPNLNAGKIKNYDVVVPPLDIQEEIVNYIKEKKNLVKKLKLKAIFIRKKALRDFESTIFEEI